MKPSDFAASAGLSPDTFTDDLLAQLNQSARANGYKDFTELQRKLKNDGSALDHESKYRLLKRLAPLHHEAKQVRNQLPTTDCTGLTRLDDVIRSIVRLIIILLFGYSQEQLNELADRMKAERAIEIDNALNQKREEARHSSKVQHIAGFVQRLSQPVRLP